MRKNAIVTGAYYSRHFDDRSKKIIKVKNSAVKLCKERIN